MNFLSKSGVEHKLSNSISKFLNLLILNLLRGLLLACSRFCFAAAASQFAIKNNLEPGMYTLRNETANFVKPKDWKYCSNP